MVTSGQTGRQQEDARSDGRGTDAHESKKGKSGLNQYSLDNKLDVPSVETGYFLGWMGILAGAVAEKKVRNICETFNQSHGQFAGFNE